MIRRLLTILFLLAVVLGSRIAEAAHFRFGSITWRVPDPIMAPLTVEFTVTTGWASASNPTTHTTELNFGDTGLNGLVSGPVIGTGVDSTGQAYTMRQYTAMHTYSSPAVYTAHFQSCCRIVNLMNGGNDNFRVQAIVDLQSGKVASSVSTAPAIVQFQIGGPRTYIFPVYDPDLDPITCRFSTSAESGIDPGQEIPKLNGTVAPVVTNTVNGCELSWDLSTAMALNVGEKYALALTFESVHGGVTSTSSIDLILELVNGPPPVCDGTGTFVVDVGQAFSHMVTGTLGSAGNLTVTTIGAPTGSTLMPPSPTTGPAPLPATFSWTPTLADAGTRVVMINYRNSTNIVGTCFLTIHVPSCPDFGDPCVAGVGECQTPGSYVCAGGTSVCNAVPGMPQTEVCDNKDNDCDGSIDDGNPGSGLPCNTMLPGVCAAGHTNCAAGGMIECLPDIVPGTQMELCNLQDDNCDGATDEGFDIGAPCTNGVGECAVDGVLLCNGTTTVCDAIPGMPQPEVCDNKDNNCDGTIDDGNPGGGAPCATGLPGVCSTGHTNCAAGMLECVPDIAPGTQPEVCNALDDNCDGAVDEGFNLGMMCTSGTGECQAAGVLVCDGMGGAACNGVPGMPQPEVCDNKDNNCDGMVDDGNPDAGNPCATGLPGVCSTGLTNCAAGGTLECVPSTTPQNELCNSLDDDCDGSTDEGFNLGMACTSGLGECEVSGMIACDAMGGAVCDAVPGQPALEICDAKDNDCDGATDEGFNVGDMCMVGIGECLATGVIVCDPMGGAGCDAVPGQPQTEMCDDPLDSDCDGDPDNGCGGSGGGGAGGTGGAGGSASGTTTSSGSGMTAGSGGSGGSAGAGGTSNNTDGDVIVSGNGILCAVGPGGARNDLSAWLMCAAVFAGLGWRRRRSGPCREDLLER